MANWSNVKAGEDMKVVSVEHVEETDPKVYLKRAKIFIGYEKYAEAEQEYLKAVKYSGKNIRYIEKLLTFYYSTKQAGFKRKADNLLDVWWQRKTLTQLVLYVISSVVFLLSAQLICEGEWEGLWFAVAGCFFNLWPNRKKCIFDIVGSESDKVFLHRIVYFFLSGIVITIISYIMGFVRLEVFGVNKIIATGCVIAAVVTFQKGISVLDRRIKQCEDRSLKILCRALLILPRIIAVVYVLDVMKYIWS